MKWLKRTESPTYQIVLPHPLTRAPIHGAFLPLQKKIKNQKSKRKSKKEEEKEKEKPKKKRKEKISKTEAQFTVSALRGSGSPFLPYLRRRLLAHRHCLQGLSPGPGSSPFSMTFRRWILKRNEMK